MAKPSALGGLMLCWAMSFTAVADTVSDAREALLRRDYPAALALLRPLAEAGDPGALYELGRLRQRGLGVPADPAAALEAFRRAADRGHAEAAYLAATLLDQGRGVPADPGGAQVLYERAAAAGHRLAAQRLRAGTEPDAALTLHRAVQRGDGASVARLASKDSVNVPDGDGRLPLGLAVAANDPALVDLLLKAGADPDMPDASGNRPLHRAARQGGTDVARRLLEAGADANATGRAGDTPLHLAVSGGHVALARLLLSRGAARDRANDAGWTPVMLAQRGGVQAIERLLEVERSTSGANLTQLEEMQRSPAMAGWSLLAVAAWTGELDLLRSLLDEGADPNAVDGSGRSALFRAVDAKRLEAAELLIARGARPESGAAEVSLIHLAAAEGPAELLPALAEDPALLDRRDAAGQTPLMAAARRGHAAGVLALLSLGADADAPDSGGTRPLHVLSQQGRRDLAERLVAAGAQLDAADAAGRSPLWWAAKKGHLDLVNLLLERGAGAVAADDGTTPLHAAAELDRPEVLEALIAAGLPADAASRTGTTPLLVAADRGRRANVQALLNAGAPVNAKNAVGDTPLICAVRNGHKEVARLLLAHDANPRQRNQRHESARDLAENQSDPEWDAVFASRGGVLGLLEGGGR